VAADWASVAVTLLLGVVGFGLARNINRDVKLRLAERRLAAYERLWALMRQLSPYSEPLDEAGRKQLHSEITDWYYAHGDGMLLQNVSRTVYLRAKDNLTGPVENLVPQESRLRLERLSGLDQERERGRLTQRQFSLLRTQLKTDLAIFGRPYGPRLGPEDRAFLGHCGVDLSRRPWSEANTNHEVERGRFPLRRHKIRPRATYVQSPLYRATTRRDEQRWPLFSAMARLPGVRTNESSKGCEGTFVGVVEGVEIPLGCCQLGVAHPVHHDLEVGASCEQP
jgi:hypothetical protein